ncbi:TonB-dependent receptor [Simiduia agarivorans]|uniref:TonB-dependent receptor n=1 Tax=Simiduia agarivorans (strain DSM 21679 / JCM 13881 / BCRC 17597 / SA1) TaxID=1117647 RepID=K4KJS9_SIMAS|nr:TonB-dependent receptor [Simiduia agarivorans]AFU99409.1 TonB-dependent receptor [Simiduia agarivorans SA1 = DSM 21679]
MKKLPLVLAIGISSSPLMAQNLVLEEVTVTAQKRPQTLQEVPISVSALDQARMEDAGIQRFEDLAAYVPNFAVVKDPVGDKINIRGIQSGNQAGFEQSVGTFVDGVYRGRGVQSRFAFLDVERVEVLRGPQGTLFGKNTIAGALNITTAKPTEEFESELSAGYTPEFEESFVKGHVSGALSDTVRARAVIQDRRMDKGWMENVHYSHDVPVSEETAGRISLEWDASDNTLVTAKAEHGNFDVQGLPWDILVAGSLSAFGVEGGAKYRTDMGNTVRPPFEFFGQSPANPTGFANDSNGVMDFGSNNTMKGDTTEASLTVEHQLASGHILTFVGGYSAYEYDRYLDADFGPLNAVRFDDSETFDQSSVELRLASDVGGDFEYIVGAFYQQNHLEADGLSYFNAGTLQPLLNGACFNGLTALGADYNSVFVSGDAGTTAAQTAAAIGAGFGQGAAIANACGQAAAFDPLVKAGINGGNRYLMLDQDSRTWAVFAQGTYHLTDSTRLTAGLRYTAETKEASHVAYATDFSENNKTATANPFVIGLATAAGEFTPHNFSKDDPGMSRDESGVTWSLNLQHDLNDTTMVYGSASTGFKAGGFNSFYTGLTQGQGADSNDVAFDEERVITFEIGSKLRLLDGAAELNAAIFHTRFDDLQAAIFTGGTTFEVQNAAKATSQGVELDGRWRATENLTLMASLGYVDFTFDAFPNQACTAAQFAAARQAAYEAGLSLGGAAGLGAAAGAAMLYNNGSCAAAGINDLAGGTSENTPQWTASLATQYVKPIGQYDLTANVDFNWMDEVYRSGDLDANALQDASHKLNGALIFGPQDGQWDISLIGKNLTNETVVSYVNDTPLFNGTFQYMVEAPRSFELRGRYRF